MSSATVTSKGQITIPQDVRTAMGIVAGDKLEFVRMQDGHFAVVAATGSVRSLEDLFRDPSGQQLWKKCSRRLKTARLANDCDR